MRLRNFLAITAVVLLATLSVVVSPRAVEADTKSDEQVFVAKINGLRALNGLPALTLDAELTTQARAWTQVMADTNSLRHASDFSIGITTQWDLLGENVGRHSVHDLDALFTAFVNSTSHLANLLNNRFDRVGVGVVYGSDGTLWTTHRFMSVDGASPSSEPIADETPGPPPTSATPTTAPPTAAPPTTAPPTTAPPTTAPPTTAPPTTTPATTAPLTSAPLRTAPSSTATPTTQPTTAVPPTTRPAPTSTTSTRPTTSSPSSTATSTPTSSTGVTTSATVLDLADAPTTRPSLRAQPTQPAASADLVIRWLVEAGGSQGATVTPAPTTPWRSSLTATSTTTPLLPEAPTRSDDVTTGHASAEPDIDRVMWVLSELAAAGL